jgi:hypothetical protein
LLLARLLRRTPRQPLQSPRLAPDPPTTGTDGFSAWSLLPGFFSLAFVIGGFGSLFGSDRSGK